MKLRIPFEKYKDDMENFELLKLLVESDYGLKFVRMMRNLVIGLKIEAETGEFPEELGDWECELANFLYFFAKEWGWHHLLNGEVNE